MSKEEKNLPQHIAIIMDGNGRWAKQRGLKRTEGHKKGAEVFREICQYCTDIGIKYVTFYAFSTENWKRPKAEVDGIMNLLRDYLKDAENFKDENIKVKFIGDLEPLADDIKELIKEIVATSVGAVVKGLKCNLELSFFNVHSFGSVLFALKKLNHFFLTFCILYIKSIINNFFIFNCRIYKVI